MLKNVCLSFALAGAASFSLAHADITELTLSSEDIDRLASDPTWLKMGRYKTGLGGKFKSDIITESYFLAETGATDPRAELVATIDALSAPIGEAADESAICRFAGRTNFLRQRTALSLPNPVDVCPLYAEFVGEGEVDGVSVLFIGSFLENPGSAFGHLLLRFHSDGDAGVSADLDDMLTNAINYGAAASEEDPMLPYVVKGLTGKYHSTFTTLPFFHHSDRFREDQLRNVWEYRLDLDQNEVDLLTGHTWELIGVENRYYFLRQNCAYRMAEMVEVVTGEEIISKSKIWVAPMDVFHAMMEGDKAIVKSVKRLASRDTVFTEGYLALEPDEKRFVDTVLTEPDTSVETHIEASGVEDPREALSVLLDRAAYKDDMGPERQREILLARFQRPSSPRRELDPPTPPHEGDKTSLFQTTVVHNEELGTGLEVRVRPAYFDFLSKTVGTAPYSELAMADTRVLIRDGELYLRQLEAVRVTALNTNTSGAPGKTRSAWRLRVGAGNRDLACDGCLVGYGEGGIGRGYQLQEGLAVYGLGSAQLELGGSAFTTLQAKAISGLVWTTDDFGWHVEGAYVMGVDDTSKSKFIGKTELRFGGGENWEFRAGLAYDEAAEGSLSVSYYW